MLDKSKSMSAVPCPINIPKRIKIETLESVLFLKLKMKNKETIERISAIIFTVPAVSLVKSMAKETGKTMEAILDTKTVLAIPVF